MQLTGTVEKEEAGGTVNYGVCLSRTRLLTTARRIRICKYWALKQNYVLKMGVVGYGLTGVIQSYQD